MARGSELHVAWKAPLWGLTFMVLEGAMEASKGGKQPILLPWPFIATPTLPFIPCYSTIDISSQNRTPI